MYSFYNFFPVLSYRFKHLYDELRKMKTEIEHIQHLLQKSKVQIQREFEEWWKRTHAASRANVSPRAAWHTPTPLSSSVQSQVSTHESSLRRSIAAQFSYKHVTKVLEKGGTSLSSPLNDDGTRVRPHSDTRSRGTENLNSQATSVSTGEHNVSVSQSMSKKNIGETRVKVDEDKSDVGREFGGGMVQTSWQQADSFSPPSHERIVCSKNKPETYLPKKKHLFSTRPDFDSHVRFVDWL